MNEILEAARRAGQQTVDEGLHRITQAAGGPARLQIILPLAGVFALDTADKTVVSARSTTAFRAVF